MNLDGSRKLLGILIAVCALISIDGAAAAEESAWMDIGVGTMAVDDRIEASADLLEYDRRSGWIHARGNAIVKRGTEQLSADIIRFNENTQQAFASGNVILSRGEEEWKGPEARYNFLTGKGEILGHFVARAGPFIVDGENPKHLEGNEFRVVNARVTTCSLDHDHWHYHMTAKNVTLVPKHYLLLEGMTLYVNRVPILYVPIWAELLFENFGIDVYPGYNTKMGFFVLSSCWYRASPSDGPLVIGRTRLDHRTRRGLAIGQDFEWGKDDRDLDGGIFAYYADDRHPAAGATNERYRVHLDHYQSLTARSDIRANIDYVSDSKVFEEFFTGEFMRESQFDNHLSYTFRGDHYVARVSSRGVINDFYSGLNRVPELGVEFVNQPIQGSKTYYSGQTAFTRLEESWATGITNKGVSVLRFDSEHMLLRPMKAFGFLNLIPRAGYRGTYYSDTLTEQVTTGSEGQVVTNWVNASGALRSRLEFGLQSSLKAFKTWKSGGNQYRHIVEPHIGYTFAPEPTLQSDQIHQLDGVDGLAMLNVLEVGVRNKLQIKRDGEPFDIIDVALYARKWLEDSGPDTIIVDAEIYPAAWLRFNSDVLFNTSEQQIEDLSARVEMVESALWGGALYYRYRNERTSVFGTDITMTPNAGWNINIYGRYEMDRGELEECGGYLQRNLDCLSIRGSAGVMPSYTDGEDDEWWFSVELWLTAFPEKRLFERNRN